MGRGKGTDPFTDSDIVPVKLTRDCLGERAMDSG